MHTFRIFSLCLISFLPLPSPAQDPSKNPDSEPLFPSPTTGPSADQSRITALTNMPFQVVAPGKFQVGEVHLDQKTRSITFPAKLNMKEGPMEYLLVAGYGKVHESVLKTRVQPFHIHLAMLLLGSKTATTNTTEQDIQQAPRQLDPAGDALGGEPIQITVSWAQKDRSVQRNIADLLTHQHDPEVNLAPEWIYNGARVWQEGIFSAQLNGSIISLITDPDALVNNVGSGRLNDDIWAPHKEHLPPPDTEVSITFELESKHEPENDSP